MINLVILNIKSIKSIKYKKNKKNIKYQINIIIVTTLKIPLTLSNKLLTISFIPGL